MADRRVLVTGGTGFIGRQVVRLLTEENVETVVVTHPTADAQLSTAVVKADLTDASSLQDLVAGCDVVVHLAARAGGILFQEAMQSGVFAANRSMTDNVLRAAHSAEVDRVFLASSAAIYRPSDSPLTESAEILGIDDGPSEYAWSKITDEVVAAWYGDLDTVIGRFGNVYGPGAPVGTPGTTVVHALIDRALGLTPGGELEVWGDGTAIRSFVYVTDVARAILEILVHAPSGSAVNVDSGEPISIRGLAELVRDEAAPGASLRFDPSKPSGPARRVPDITLLRGLGFSPATDLSEGIRLTAAEMRQRRVS